MSRYVDEHHGRFVVEPIGRFLDGGVRFLPPLRRPTLRARRGRWRFVEQIGELRRQPLRLQRSDDVPGTAARCELVGPDRVKRLVREQDILGATQRGKPWRTTTPDPVATRSRDRVNRDFTANRPNALWVAAVTYVAATRAWCS